jgi:hypothetical protein
VRLVWLGELGARWLAARAGCCGAFLAGAGGPSAELRARRERSAAL